MPGIKRTQKQLPSVMGMIRVVVLHQVNQDDGAVTVLNVGTIKLIESQIKKYEEMDRVSGKNYKYYISEHYVYDDDGEVFRIESLN